MKKSSKDKPKEPISQRFLTELIGIYLLLLCIIYPLYYERAFYNIGDAKWRFFRIITYYSKNKYFTIPTFLFLAAVGLIWFLIALAKKKELKSFFLSRVCSTDIFVLLYGIFTGITCMITPYRKFFVWGFPTWYMGLLFQIAIVLMYFLVAYFWRWDDKAFLVFMCATAFVLVIGVLNRFYIDPLGFYESGSEELWIGFISTIGQRTMYSGYLMTIFPMGVYVYWDAEKKWIKIASFLFTIIGFMSIITQNAESVFLGLAGMFAVLFWFSFRSNKSMKGFLEIVLMMLLSWRVVGFIQMAIPGSTEGNDTSGINLFATQSPYIWPVIIVVAAIYFLLLYKIKKDPKFDIASLKKIRNVIMILGFAGLVLLILYIVLNSLHLLPEAISNTKPAGRYDNNFFVFNDDWGNARGISWRAAVQGYFATFTDDPLRFIFGCGPDEFYEMIYKYMEAELRAYFGQQQLICAHNEWMNQFVNGGIAGGITYLGIFVSSFVLMARDHEKYPEVIGILMCMASYFTHNCFCYQRLTCTPYVIVFIAAGINILRYKGIKSIAAE